MLLLGTIKNHTYAKSKRYGDNYGTQVFKGMISKDNYVAVCFMTSNVYDLWHDKYQETLLKSSSFNKMKDLRLTPCKENDIVQQQAT